MMRRALASVVLFSACARDFAVPERGSSSLSGRAVAEAPGTGRSISASGSRVELVGTGVAVLADAEGLFAIANPPPPPRTLLIQWSSAGGGAFDRQRVLRSAQLDRSGVVDLGEILVAANAEVRGRVVLADKPRDGLDQVGTVVFVPGYPYSAVTGPGGGFWLPNLPPGRLSFGFSRPGYAVGAVEGVELAPGAALELRETALSPLPPDAPRTGGIQGTAVKLDGTPAAGASATATAAQGGAASSAVAGADGAFSFSDLASGAYTVSVTADGLAALVGGVLVPGGGVYDLGAITLTGTPIAAPATTGPPPPPLARIGPDAVVAPGTPVLLDGSASQGVRLVYHWAQVGDPKVAFAVNDSTQAARTSFTAPEVGVALSFTLEVEDAFGQRSDPAQTTVLVDHAPVAALSALDEVNPGVTVLLDAGGSSDADPGDPLAFTFEQTLGAPVTLVAGADPARRTFVPAVEGSLRFRVIVDDGHLATASDEVTILVAARNHPPVAIVNSPTALAGQDVVLDGSLSYDVDPRDQGALRFRWTAEGGAPGLAGDASSAVAHLTAPGATGTYGYRLTVTDTSSESASAVALVTVVPPPPAPRPAPPAILALSPADGSSGASVLQSVEVQYDKPLDAASVDAGAVSVTEGSAPVAGSTAYEESGGFGGQPFRRALVFRPQERLPAGVLLTASVAAVKDPYGQLTQPRTWSFTTRAPAWVDISPADPQRTGTYGGAPAGGVSFSFSPFAPGIASGPAGAYLVSIESGAGPTPTTRWYLRRWKAGTRAWPEDTDFQARVKTAIASSPTPPADQKSPFYPFQRAYVLLDAAGVPFFVYEHDTTSLKFFTGTLANASTNTVTGIRHGQQLATDGSLHYFATMGCYSSYPARNTIYVLAMERGFQQADAATVGVVTTAGSGSACDVALLTPANDVWHTPPALASGGGRLYLAYGRQDSASDPYRMRMFTRTATTGPFGLLTSPEYPDGVLSAQGISARSFPTMTSSTRGPVLVFIEGTSPAQLRAVRWDQQAQRFLDPTTGSPGIGPVDPALPEGPFTSPTIPAVLVVGNTTYVATTASGARGKGVWVAHADQGSGWTADLGPRQDGALSVHPGCDVSMPALALVDGLPTVAWSESCPIFSQTQTQNFLVVKRLE